MLSEMGKQPIDDVRSTAHSPVSSKGRAGFEDGYRCQSARISVAGSGRPALVQASDSLFIECIVTASFPYTEKESFCLAPLRRCDPSRNATVPIFGSPPLKIEPTTFGTHFAFSSGDLSTSLKPQKGGSCERI
jgi:hypothetical protein